MPAEKIDFSKQVQVSYTLEYKFVDFLKKKLTIFSKIYWICSKWKSKILQKIQKKLNCRNHNLWLTMHTIPLDLQFGLRARSHNLEICGSKFTGTPWTWKVVSVASMEFLWNMAHKGYFSHSCMYICNKSIPSSAQYLTLQKIFLTSKFGYLLFCIPTLKLKLTLHRQGFFILV
jgi:hypothetical protein